MNCFAYAAERPQRGSTLLLTEISLLKSHAYWNLIVNKFNSDFHRTFFVKWKISYFIIIFFVKRTVICVLGKNLFNSIFFQFPTKQEYIFLLIPNHVMLVTSLFLRSNIRAEGLSLGLGYNEQPHSTFYALNYLIFWILAVLLKKWNFPGNPGIPGLEQFYPGIPG